MMTTTLATELLLTEKQGLYFDLKKYKPTDQHPNWQLVATFNKMLEPFGYTLAEESIQVLAQLERQTLIQWIKEQYQLLNYVYGKRDKQEAFYPNFPEQVMEASEVELYLNAICHYASEGEWLPSTLKQEVLPLIPIHREEPLNLLTVMGFDIFPYMVSQKLASATGISSTDQAFIQWLVETYPKSVEQAIPPVITHKETLCFMTSLCYRNEAWMRLLKPHFNNATDVLRLAVAIQGGDVSLSTKPSFKSFKRAERRLLMDLLASVQHDILEELWQRRSMWLKFSQKVHPMEYMKYPAYEKVGKAFEHLHNYKKPLFYNARLEKAFEEENLFKVVELLTKRPSLFARYLDRALRLEVKLRPDVEHSYVLHMFEDVVFEVPSTILLPLHAHFKHRHETSTFRAFFPKGNVGKCYGIDKGLVPFREVFTYQVVHMIEAALVVHYSSKEEMGHVYLDESMKQYAIPFAQRSASKSLNTVARGSRLSLDGAEVIRPFVYWKEGDGSRCDLDLSVALLDETLNVLEEVSYSNLRSLEYNVVHSGDRVSGADSASEYIDLHLETLAQNNVAYAVLTVHSFTRTPFIELAECFAGFMIRDGITGEVFEPTTVKHKFDLTTASEVNLPFIIDVQKRELIWVDMAIPSEDSINNLSGTRTAMSYAVKAMIHHHKPNLHDLFRFHCEARMATMVESLEEAQFLKELGLPVLIISETGDLRPTHHSEILANYL